MHDIGPPRLETESFEADGQWRIREPRAEWESPFTEIQEMGLASALLEVTNESELDRFLGNVFRTIESVTGRFARSDAGRALGGILKGAARQALPLVGGAVGQWISPARGAPSGADIGRVAGQIFGLETEGLSAEDQEFELARQFVRFAGAAIRGVGQAAPSTPPAEAARAAAAAAARVYAPGFLPRLRGRSGMLWPRSGRWVRRGRMIILYGM